MMKNVFVIHLELIDFKNLECHDSFITSM